MTLFNRYNDFNDQNYMLPQRRQSGTNKLKYEPDNQILVSNVLQNKLDQNIFKQQQLNQQMQSSYDVDFEIEEISKEEARYHVKNRSNVAKSQQIFQNYNRAQKNDYYQKPPLIQQLNDTKATFYQQTSVQTSNILTSTNNEKSFQNPIIMQNSNIYSYMYKQFIDLKDNGQLNETNINQLNSLLQVKSQQKYDQTELIKQIRKTQNGFNEQLYQENRKLRNDSQNQQTQDIILNTNVQQVTNAENNQVNQIQNDMQETNSQPFNEIASYDVDSVRSKVIPPLKLNNISNDQPQTQFNDNEYEKAIQNKIKEVFSSPEHFNEKSDYDKQVITNKVKTDIQKYRNDQQINNQPHMLVHNVLSNKTDSQSENVSIISTEVQNNDENMQEEYEEDESSEINANLLKAKIQEIQHE